MSRVSVVRFLFAVYDMKAEAFYAPFVAPNEDIAKRFCSEMVMDAASVFGKHSADMSLFEVGEWDETLGVVKSLEKPRLVCLLQALRRSE